MAESHAAIIERHEKELDELRRLFDLYFQGIERQPPTDIREELRKALLRLRGEASRWNTAERFRVNALHQRFTSFDRMWSRELKAIEEGTSRRDRFRIQRKRKLEEEAPPATERSAPAPVPEGSQPRAAAQAARSAGDSGLDENKMRKLYEVYMQAKRRTGERSSLTYEGLVKQLQKQVPALKAKHKCKDVDFKVVLKDGKAMLKAIPKN